MGAIVVTVSPPFFFFCTHGVWWNKTSHLSAACPLPAAYQLTGSAGWPFGFHLFSGRPDRPLGDLLVKHKRTQRL
jgi:hypothetical protein